MPATSFQRRFLESEMQIASDRQVCACACACACVCACAYVCVCLRVRDEKSARLASWHPQGKGGGS